MSQRPPRSGGGRAGSRGGAAAGAASRRQATPRQQTPPRSNDEVGESPGLRRDVDDLRLEVRRLHEALRRLDRRVAEGGSQSTRHAARVMRLDAAVGALSAAGAGGCVGGGGGLPAALLPLQLQEVVAAVLAQLQACEALPDADCDQRQRTPVAPAWGGAPPPGVGVGSSRAASLEPDFALGRHHQQHQQRQDASLHLALAGAGASLVHPTTSLAGTATTHTLPVQTPLARSPGAGAANPFSSGGSLSSVMHSGETLQDAGSPGQLLATGTSSAAPGRGTAGGGGLARQQQQEGSVLESLEGNSSGSDSASGSDSGSDEEWAAGTRGKVNTAAAGGAPPTRATAKRRGTPIERSGGAQLQEQGNSSKRPRAMQQQHQQQQQQQQQLVMLRLGKLLSSLRSAGAQPPADESVVAAALAEEAASRVASPAAVAEAFRAVALSGAAASWDASRMEGEHDPRDLGLLAWATDTAAEGPALRRLARCARLLVGRLPDAPGRAFAASLAAHLGAVMRPAAAAASCGGRRAGVVAQAGGLPFACAAAAALAHVLHELGRADEARALAWDLLAQHHVGSSSSSSSSGGLPALPMVLAAVTAWPEALQPFPQQQQQQQQAVKYGSSEFALADPLLALLHVALKDVCTAAAVSGPELDLDHRGAAGQSSTAQFAADNCSAGVVMLAVAPGWFGEWWELPALQGDSTPSAAGGGAVQQVVASLQAALLRQLRGGSGGGSENAEAVAVTAAALPRDGASFADQACAALQQAVRLRLAPAVVDASVGRLQAAARECLATGLAASRTSGGGGSGSQAKGGLASGGDMDLAAADLARVTAVAISTIAPAAGVDHESF
jgi:hypothetical protein